jgi:hypothetical protein
MANDKTVPTVAICAVVRDEASYVEEWVEFHRRQRVTAFRIYDNGSIDGTPDVLRGLGIEPAIWAGRPVDFDHQQRQAYIEGASMLASKAEWVAFIDVDEFMFGRGGRTLAEALVDMPAEAGAVAVQQRVFGSGCQKTRQPGGVLERFTRCAAENCGEHVWFKTIARPDLVGGFDSVHSVTLRSGTYVMADGSLLTRTGNHPGEASRRVEGAVGLHHYPLKSLQEYRMKQAKWADRAAASRVNDDYFFERDAYANAVECLELTGFGKQIRSLLPGHSDDR